ncbi:MAG: hypothetical protein AB8I08_04040 [Sandaracinaceae bacterium]
MQRHLAPLALVLSLSSCAGPATPSQLPTVRLSYNEAIVRSANEQLLLNLVRLRYLHAPQFFEVTAVTTQSAVTTGSAAGITSNLGNNLIDNSIFTPFVSPTIGGSVSIEERPTVSYVPLQGEAFAQRMVRPIRPETIFSMVNVGWRIDRLFACCVQRVNEMSSPVIASSDAQYGGDAFRQLGNALYELQMRGALEFNAVQVADGETELRLTFVTADEGREATLMAQIQEALGLDPSLRSYRVLAGHAPETAPDVAPPAPSAPVVADAGAEGDVSAPVVVVPPAPASSGADHLILRGRSLLGALFYLSHGISIPDGDPGARSLDYTDDDGSDVTVANPVPGALLSIAVSTDEPEDAYVTTQYRDHWFSLSDLDLESKQTFLLLQVLFSVLSSSEGAGPVLTIPLGG